MALDAARSWALRRAARCREMHLKTFGASGAGAYDVVIDEAGSRTHVFVVHCPSGERDDCASHVSAFEIVEPSAGDDAEKAELFPPPPQENTA